MSYINKTQWSYHTQESTIISGQHDAVIVTVPIKKNIAQMPGGTLVSIDLNSGEVFAKDADSDIFGILTQDYQQEKSQTANVLLHGAVNLQSLQKAKRSALSTTEIVSLINKGIYPL
ncbi:MAG: hypothetical protein ACRCVN_05110 [Spirochaetia bacterium]